MLSHARELLRSYRLDSARDGEHALDHLFDVIEASAEAIELLSADGTILYVTPAIERVGGRAPAELVGRNAFEWTHPDDLATLEAEFRDFLRQPGAVVTSRSRYRHKDGSWRWAEATCTNRLGDPSVAAIVANVRDVTARKSAEDEAREWRSRYEAAVRATGQVLYDWDSATNVIIWGGDYERILGYGHGQMPPDLAGWVDLIHPEDRDAFMVKAQDVSATGDPFTMDYRVRRADGAVIHIEDRGHFFRDAAGRADRMVGFVADVTERKQAADELRKTAALLQAVADGTTDAVFVKDRDGKYLLCNDATARFLGRDGKDIIGRGDAELFDPDSARLVRDRDLRVMASGRAETGEEVLTAGGRTRAYQATKAPYRDAGGNVVGLIGVSRDVTEVKLMEERLRQAQKMEAVGRLAGGIAHDFNNLLTVIIGNCDLMLESQTTGDPARSSVEDARRAAERAAGLTRQLLTFSRKQVFSRTTLLLNTLLKDATRLIRRLVEEDVELVVRAGHDPLWVSADPVQLEQVVMNLAVNARDAMPAGGTLTVELEGVEVPGGGVVGGAEVPPGRYAVLRVADTGSGMSDEVKAHMFEPFFTTKPVGQGTGLGLATVFGVVTQSGGRVGVESVVGRGTTFSVYLPTVPEPEPDAGKWVSEADRRGTETVLVVEDEAGVRGLAATVLRKNGYTVLTAADGEAAWDLAGRCGRPVDLLLTDVVMPRMGGRQLVERLAAARPGVKVIFMSGYTDDAVVRHGIQEDTVHFLQKPFTPSVLARMVREVLDSDG